MVVIPLRMAALASEGSCWTLLHFPDFLLDLHPSEDLVENRERDVWVSVGGMWGPE